jgi:hypothetical protein
MKILPLAVFFFAGLNISAQEIEREFNPRTVIPRAFPAIIDAPFLKATEVKDEVLPDELVLGVVIGDDARVYPINQLTGPKREIINDTVGGRRIAATW